MHRIATLSIFILLFLGHTHAIGQNITISGYVLDSINRERQPGALVVEWHSRHRVVSNEYGFFSLSVPLRDSVKIGVYMPGFLPALQTFQPFRDTIFTVLLSPTAYQLGGVEIKAGANPAEAGNKMEIPLQTIRELPALAGQVDILRSFQLLPGISGGAEGSTGLHIRGGSPDQNLILMDDVPLYYVNHLGGFLSVFNADAIQGVQVYKSNPPARFGGRLSGVTDVRLREGSAIRHKMAVEVGLLSTAIMAEGPFKKQKTTYLLSLRRFNYDWIMQAVNLKYASGYKSPYFTFSDINAKISHVFSEKDRISLSFFSGSDRYVDRPGRLNFSSTVTEDRYKLSWGNRMAAFRWNHIWTPHLFSNTIVSASDFQYASNQYGYMQRRSGTTVDSESEQRLDFTSRIQDVILRNDFIWSPGSQLTAKFGFVATQHWFSPNVSAYKNTSPTVNIDTVVSPRTLAVFEPAVYGEFNWAFRPGWNLSGGLFWAFYRIEDTLLSLPQPQGAVSYQARHNLNFHASVNKRLQGLHLLTGNGLGLPVDLWLPATKNAPPQGSAQMAAGSRWDFGGKSAWVFHADVFAKRFSNQIDFQEGASFFTGSQEWEEKIERNGKGLAYGLEFLVEKKQGKNTGWLSYTWSKNTRQFANINQGAAYPYIYDRRHNLAFVYQRQLRKNIKLSADWVFASGTPLTLPAAIYPTIEPGYQNSSDNRKITGLRFVNALYYNRVNGYRMPAYHRLDLSFQFLKHKKNGDRIWTFGIYNAYNRLNPYYLYYGFDRNKSQYRLYQFTLFPAVPAVSYRRTFDWKKG